MTDVHVESVKHILYKLGLYLQKKQFSIKNN